MVAVLPIPLPREASLEDGPPGENPLQSISASTASHQDDSSRATSPDNTSASENGSLSGDSLGDVPPRPTSPTVESSGTLNAETNFISSNSEMATKLCGVCTSIPAWF